MYTSTLEILPGNAPIQPVQSDDLRFGIKLYRDDEVFGVDVEDTRNRWNILVFMSGAYTPDMGYMESGVYVAPVLDLQDWASLGEHFEGFLLSIPFSLWHDLDIYNLERRFMSFHFRPYVELDMKEAQRLCIMMNMMEASLSDGNTSDNDKEIIYLCRAFIASISRYFSGQKDLTWKPHETNAAGNRYVDEFIRLVKKHCLKEKKLDFYASQLGITPKYLSIIISKDTGKKAGKWISDCVIEAVNRLLCSTSSQINEIAETLGFATSSEFCRYYRANTGITPLQYRKECLRQGQL